jgi:predicted nucleic acid-binding protein
MIYYADSSFLVSCYIVDANTAQAKAYLTRTAVPLVFTALHDLEIHNALELGIFRGLLTAAQAAAASANLHRDLHAGLLLREIVRWTPAFNRAAVLSRQHSASLGTRSIDILHVAAAKGMRASRFVTFDSRQRALATAAGLQVAP